MGIENLLAQGVEIRPAGMERNALMQFQQFQDAKQRNALMQMQMQDVHAQRQLAIQQAQQVAADRARMEQARQSIPSPQMQASQQALAGGGGPTVANAAQMRPVDPRLQMLHGAMQAGMGTPLDYINAANPQNKIKDYKAVRAADGSVSYVGLTEDGRVVQTGQQPFEKPEVKSFGNFMGGIDPISGKVTQYGAIGQSADNAASNARMAADAAAGRAQSDRQFNTRRADELAKPPGGNKRTGPMSVTLQKELLESDDAVQSSASVVRALEAAKAQNSKAYDGYFAKQRAQLVSNTLGSDSADATIDIDNLMTGQGLDQMKSIFGAAPTEGERKILMDMQASVDKTPKQREAIIDRAIAAAKRRSDYAANKAKAIRDGSYLTEGIQAPAPAANGGKPTVSNW